VVLWLEVNVGLVRLLPMEMAAMSLLGWFNGAAVIDVDVDGSGVNCFLSTAFFSTMATS